MGIPFWGKVGLGVLLAGFGFISFVRSLETGNLYSPSQLDGRTPKDAGLAYEDVNFRSGDGVMLHGWFVPGQGASRNLLYCHGNAGNIADRIMKVRRFTELGFNVFIFDYRGYGRSSGSPTENGLYLDARAAFDHLVSRPDTGKLPLIVYGTSLGGAVAVNLAAHRSPSALITEASFSSISDMADVYYPWVPKFLLSAKFDSAAKAAGIRTPKMFMHSPTDEIIPFSLAKKLFSAAAEPKVFITLEGAHNDDPFNAKPGIREELLKFLEQYGI